MLVSPASSLKNTTPTLLHAFPSYSQTIPLLLLPPLPAPHNSPFLRVVGELRESLGSPLFFASLQNLTLVYTWDNIVCKTFSVVTYILWSLLVKHLNNDGWVFAVASRGFRGSNIHFILFGKRLPPLCSTLLDPQHYHKNDALLLIAVEINSVSLFSTYLILHTQIVRVDEDNKNLVMHLKKII